jgi:hypothetical protein
MVALGTSLWGWWVMPYMFACMLLGLWYGVVPNAEES